MTKRLVHRGISLIEAMVSLSLISIAIVGTLASFPTIARMSHSTRLQSQALYYAQAMADEILREAALNPKPLPVPFQTDYVGIPWNNTFINGVPANGIHLNGQNVGGTSDEVANGQMTRTVQMVSDTMPGLGGGVAVTVTDVSVTVTWLDNNNGSMAQHSVSVYFSY
ncbi:MAG: type IV pilus modification PilV family protein [Candidatus Xenobia bacterium]